MPVDAELQPVLDLLAAMEQPPPMEAGPDGMEVICIGGHKAEGQDGILVEDFWP